MPEGNWGKVTDLKLSFIYALLDIYVCELLKWISLIFNLLNL